MEKKSKNMSVKNIGEPTEDLFIMFGSDTTKIFEEINRENRNIFKKRI